MQIGRIVGYATSTVKHPSMTGWRLPIVQMLGTDGGPDGEPILAIDAVGAGVGDNVLMCNDGSETRQMTKNKNTPVRWFVMGLCDE